LNVISLLLALRVRGISAFDALLAADTDGESSNRAIERLAKMSESEVRFDFVKVAHHGSWASHKGTKLYQLCKNKSHSVAVISTGADFDVLPDRKVMEQFLAEGWVLLLTTKRSTPKSQYNAVIETAASQPTEYSVQSQTISVKWGETSGLQWKPPVARVRYEDLSAYQTSDV
jgi:beta-lactamase superfamily II metal-dependent hydrolase